MMKGALRRKVRVQFAAFADRKPQLRVESESGRIVVSPGE